MATVHEYLEAHGIERVGSKARGFRYRKPGGGRVTAEERARIEALKLPPAWTQVLIHPSATSRVQAVGRDSAGRLQYRYHPTWVQRQESRKYQRLVHFAQALPKMRRRIDLDLRRAGLSRERVLAGMLRIMSLCFLRAGSEVYARENGSFGIATLRPRHVSVRGDTVRFDFPGKSGQRQVRELKDRRVAHLVQELLAVPGRDVFKFVLDDGAVVDVRRRHLNDYIREVMGEHFSAKDFRTWAGTLICACALARCECIPCTGKAVQKRAIVAAVKETAQHLGNTPAVCRTSYISPRVIEGFQKGVVVEHPLQSVRELALQQTHSLHAAERALLSLLLGTTKARAVARVAEAVAQAA